MIVLGLTGLARSGKDTAARRLVKAHGFERFALADAVKEAALRLDPIIGSLAIGYERLSEIVDAEGWEVAKNIPEVRRTLQRLGTEAGWQLHGEQLWTSQCWHRIAESGAERVVVTDIRMPHELRWLRSHGGRLVEVRRPGTGLLGQEGRHVSEQGPGRADLVIDNDGDLQTLYSRTDAIVWALLANTNTLAAPLRCCPPVADEQPILHDRSSVRNSTTVHGMNENTHRIIVWRYWYSGSGRLLLPSPRRGAPKSGTPRWHVDCTTCERSLGDYATEQEARSVRCINQMQEDIEARCRVLPESQSDLLRCCEASR